MSLVTLMVVAMSKYGKSNWLKGRRASRASAAAAESGIVWAPKSGEPTFEKRNTTQINATTKVSSRTVHFAQSNLIVEFAVVVSRFVDGAWTEVLCIDSCNHGTVHRHRDGDHGSDPEVIALITSQRIVQDSYWDAIDEAYDEAERE